MKADDERVCVCLCERERDIESTLSTDDFGMFLRDVSISIYAYSGVTFSKFDFELFVETDLIPVNK